MLPAEAHCIFECKIVLKVEIRDMTQKLHYQPIFKICSAEMQMVIQMSHPGRLAVPWVGCSGLRGKRGDALLVIDQLLRPQ